MLFARKGIAVICTAILVMCAGLGGAAGSGDGQGSPSCQQVLRDRFVTLHEVADPLGAHESSLGDLWLEEFLAREVYLAFQSEHCDNLLEIDETCVFANIANAENQHLKLLERLIVAYGLMIPEPPVDPQWWEDRYWPLVDQGSTLIGALKAGVLVEADESCELDAILEWSLPGVYPEQWDDVALVAQNLSAGERNHLRALVKAIVNLGGEYVWDCESIDPELILDAEMERHVVFDADGEILAECGGSPRRGGN